MHIEYLALQRFRNLKQLELKFSPGRVFIEGNNGQGKTNLLEAIFFCATGKSFRRATHQQIIHHQADTLQLSARIERKTINHKIEISLAPKKRSIQVDGRGIKKTSSLFELLNVVAFFPDDLRIVKGSPEERRRFLDRFVANRTPSFVDASAQYTKLLTSRNALLKNSPRLDPLLLETYDDGLISHGVQMHQARLEALSSLRPYAAKHVESILGSGTALRVEIDSGFEAGPTKEEFALRFREALKASFQKDRARGITSVGPHRADLEIYLGDLEARHYASQGQQRAIVLAMKLGEVELLKEHLSAAPILLLDDVSSELDSGRTAQLFDLISAVGGQVFVTTTGAATLPRRPEDQCLKVEDGCVFELTE